MMIQETKHVNTAAKDILARLLASENLTVQHDHKAETAYFDTKNRVLCLPVWQDMDSFMYDMLVGHEVSHALFTPADGWQEYVGDDVNSPLRHMCLNICEDARIERKIKDKFPGLRRDFAKAYKILHDRDIFGLDGKNVSEMPLIDRINLYYKGEIYGQMTVPFTKEEYAYITRLDDATSFEDVIEVARDLYDVTKEEQDQKKQDQVQSEIGEDSVGAGAGAGGSNSEKGESEDSGMSAGAGGEGDEDGEQGTKGAAGQDGEEDSGASADDDTDDGESADSTDGDAAQNGDTGDDLSYDSYEDGHMPGNTQQDYESAKKSLRDSESAPWSYYDIPKSDLSKIVISPERIAELWSNYWKTVSTTSISKTCPTVPNEFIESNKTLHDFQSRAKPIINHMVQQFQQKQAADASKRSHVAKTGVLDTTTMINYRWSEDIFLKNETHADGKSHGIVIFLDWSGSMHTILKDTIEQLLVIVEFCRKAGIPYDVHAFTSNPFFIPDPKKSSEMNYRSEEREAAYNELKTQFDVVDGKTLSPHVFQLLNFLSSKQNSRQHIEAVKNLYFVGGSTYRCPRCLGLGSTPLNEAILAAHDLVPKFQNENGVQIVNTVFLTDGDGHRITDHWGGSKVLITDPKTKRTFDASERRSDTSALLESFKNRTGSNTIGIRLHESNNIKNLRYRYFDGSNWEVENKRFQDASECYKKNHHFVCDIPGYDLHLVVKGELKVETDPLDDLDENASNTRIRNAFIRGGNRKKSSRVIANRLMDLIAVG